MNDAAIDTAATAATAEAQSYPRRRPRLMLLAREDTGLDYRASGSSAPPPPPPADEPEAVADWGRVHARLVELGAERAVHERELCRSLRSRIGVPTSASALVTPARAGC